jgi:excinuclease ABC subunit A
MRNNKLVIYGASEHNLQSIDLELPRDQLIVFSGVSGSGKSSLAFDTIYAEGQRRYVESLSAYARQFLERMQKPRMDHIDGLSPAIAIEQKAASGNPRSTVATVTEIHDYLRVLYARVGKPFCPECDVEISSQTPEQIVDNIMRFDEGTRMQVLAPVVRGRRGEHGEVLANARRLGFARVRIDGDVHDLSDKIRLDDKQRHDIEVVVDRLVLKEKVRSRLADSVETALKIGDGMAIANIVGVPRSSEGNGRKSGPARAIETGDDVLFSERFACRECGFSFGELTPQMFSFNSPYGMCEECGGLGTRQEIDPDLLVADPSKSLMDGALELYGTLTSLHAQHLLEGLAAHYGFKLTIPWRKLSQQHREAILFGSGDEEIEFQYRTRAAERSGQGASYKYKRVFEGIVPASDRKYRGTRSAATKDYYGRFMSQLQCPDCDGSRLRRESCSVRIADTSIVDVCAMCVSDALEFFDGLRFSKAESTIASQLLKEIQSRLTFLKDVGLGYLTLDRAAPTLSGGEAQRIHLATQIGARLAGVLYILDEPSIGLHYRDHSRLLETLFRLRDLGNTVIVVEHDASTIRSADFVVDFGPGAGTQGGKVVYSGSVENLLTHRHSLTGRYLSGRLSIRVPKRRRKPEDGKYLTVRQAREHNLQRIDVKIPLGLLTCVTGVSGSGKSTLVNEILYRGLARRLSNSPERPGRHDGMDGLEFIDKVININQSPIGRTPRSNPGTYVGAFSAIRELFSQTPEARVRGYSPGRFSFNVKGGRCDECEGDGMKRVEMHFLPDVYVTCEACGGSRFSRETLQVSYKGKNIAEVLDMTVREALAHFENVPRLKRILQTLDEVGLDYIKVGQPAPTLSGGEAQRVKLAKELSKIATGRTFYILDEPTTGLHFADIEKLLGVLNRLVDAGNTVVVIEHNMDVIKVADNIIDLGPEGGDEGGKIVGQGTPEQIAKLKDSYTGNILREHL